MTKRRMRFGFACATESPHFGQFMNRYCARLVLRVLLVLVGISLAGCVRLAPVVEAGGVQTGWGERWDRRIGLEAMAIDTREKAASGEPIPDYALTGLSLCGVCLETQTARVDGVCMRLISVPTSVVRGFDVSVLGGNQAVFGLQCTALAGFSGPTTGVSVAGLVNAGVGGYGWRGALLASGRVQFGCTSQWRAVRSLQCREGGLRRASGPPQLRWAGLVPLAFDSHSLNRRDGGRVQ